MTEEVKDAPQVKGRKKTAPVSVVLLNKSSQDVFIGEGLDAICIPPRGKAVLDSDLVPEVLPASVIKSELK